MKKYIFLAAALMAMGCGMSSCSNEADVTEQTEQTPKLTKLTFTVAQDAETRVNWGGTNGRTPVFVAGDKVSLFSEHNTNTELTVKVAGGVVTLEGEGTSGDTDLYFVYPYDADAWYDYTVDSETIFGNASIGTASPYNYDSDNSINPGIGKYPSNALSLAMSTDGGTSAITFQSLTTIIKFTPLSDRMGYILINAGHDAFPSIGVDIDLNESKITTESMVTNISLPKEDDMYDFEAGTSYYFALPPFTMASGGMIMFIDDEDDSYLLFTAGAEGKNFVAGKIYTLNY